MRLKSPKEWLLIGLEAALVGCLFLGLAGSPAQGLLPGKIASVLLPAEAFADKSSTATPDRRGKVAAKSSSAVPSKAKKAPAKKTPVATPRKRTTQKKATPISSSAKARLAYPKKSAALTSAPKSKTISTADGRAAYPRIDQQPPAYSIRAQIDALEVVSLRRNENNVSLLNIPQLNSILLNRVAAVTPNNEYIFFTLQPKLQDLTERLVKESNSPNVAVVVMDPRTGKILALADKSPSIRNLALYAGFPAASLFKVVTAAAAVEQAAVSPYTTVPFRGGTYTLNEYNYLPDRKKDRRSMSIAEALGRSCNPVFGRIALKYLSPEVIRSYADQFGFNEALPFELPLALSQASIPDGSYEMSRTAAGFGAVSLSPVHAATVMSGIANKGILPKPYLVDRIVSSKGEVLYKAQPAALRRLVKAETASKLLQMMEYTTTIGTSRREFVSKNRPVLGNIDVAAKTGTLRGDNPEGINNWFIATAPIENPEIAVAVVVVHPSGISSRASNIGRQILQDYFK